MPVSFEKYISEVKSNNKKLFAAEKIQITPKSLENLLEKSFNAGFIYCENLKNQTKDSGGTDFGNIFGDIFKKK